MKIKLIFVGTLILFAACNQHGASSDYGADAIFMDEVQEEAEMAKSIAVPKEPADQVAPPDQRVEKKVVKNGSLHFRSKSVEKDYLAIKALLPGYEAYIDQENQYRSGTQINYNLTLKVPAERFDSLFQDLTSLGEELENKSTNIQDVTARYYDLETRIKNKKALEERYRQLLNQATAIKDILEIEDKINQIRTDIESYEGQFRLLSHQISLSTIQVSFYELLPYTYDAGHRPGFFARLGSGMSNGWQLFLSFMVGTLSLWPFLLLVIVLIVGFRKWRKNKKSNPST